MKQAEEPVQVVNMINHCNLCGKKSDFFCGRCNDVGYCKADHQKADWPAHRPKCISME
jgi:hypothetical protein